MDGSVRSRTVDTMHSNRGRRFGHLHSLPAWLLCKALLFAGDSIPHLLTKSTGDLTGALHWFRRLVATPVLRGRPRQDARGRVDSEA